MKNLVIIFLLLSFLGCNQKKTSKSNTQFQQCCDNELMTLLLQAEKLLDNHVLKFYQTNNETLEECYSKYLEAWADETRMSLVIDSIPNLAIERQLLNSIEIRDILDWSLNMGDSIWVYERSSNEDRLINFIQISPYGQFANYLMTSNEKFAQVLIKEKHIIGDIGPINLAKGILRYLNSGVNIDYDIIKKIIVVELYLYPMAIANWEEEDLK